MHLSHSELLIMKCWILCLGALTSIWRNQTTFNWQNNVEQMRMECKRQIERKNGLVYVCLVFMPVLTILSNQRQFQRWNVFYKKNIGLLFMFELKPHLFCKWPFGKSRMACKVVLSKICFSNYFDINFFTVLMNGLNTKVLLNLWSIIKAAF